jgi:hypothetical protein
VFNEADEEVQDFTVSLQPGVDVGVRTPRFTLVTRAHAGYAFYLTHREERAFNPFGSVFVERRFPRVAISADGSVGWRKERSGFEIESRPRILTRAATVRARVTGRRLQLEARATATDVAYEENARYRGVFLATALDRETRAAGVGAEYRLTPFTSLTLAGDVVADRFPNAVERHTDSAAVLAGVIFNPKALVSGSAAVGARVMRPLGGTSSTGLITEGGLGWRWRDRVGVTAGAKRNVDYSYRLDRPFLHYDLYELAIRQALWRGLDLGARGAQTRMVHSVSGSRAGADPATRELLNELTLSTGVRLSRGARIGVYATQWERRADERSYKTLRSGVEVTLGGMSINERGVYVYGPAR